MVDDAAAGPSGTSAPDSHGRGAKEGAYVGTLEDAVLHNANQFHKWHAELEAACASEMEEKYKRYADLLNSHLQSCDGILAKVSHARCLVCCCGPCVVTDACTPYKDGVC